jgi:hypothetical protein
MISNQVDLAGLLLMMYPRPVFVAAAVLDYFPIEGTHKTVREVTELYGRFHHADHVGIAEGYHGHEYSIENQEAAMSFLDHFNGCVAIEVCPWSKNSTRKRCTARAQGKSCSTSTMRVR